MGMDENNKKMRADMCLPNSLRNFGLGCLLVGIVLFVLTIILKQNWPMFLGMLLLITGVSMLLSWRNQTITILNEDEFIYKTFGGKATKYKFSEITDLKQNPDSMTLFVGKNKIHIESIAVMSDRLTKKINEQLNNK